MADKKLQPPARIILAFAGAAAGATAYYSLKITAAILASVLLLMFALKYLKAAFILFVFIVPIAPYAIEKTSLIGSNIFTPTKILGALVLVSWLYNTFITRRQALIQYGQYALILLFSVTLIYSMVNAINTSSYLVSAYFYLHLFLLYVITVNLVDSKKTLEGVLIAVLISNTLVGLFEAWQYMKYGLVIGGSEVISNFLMHSGYSTDPNQRASFFAASIPIGMYFLLRQKNLILRLANYSCMAILTYGIFTSHSRTGFIAMTVAFSLIMVKEWRRKAAWIVLTLLLALILLSSTSEYWFRIGLMGDLITEQRYNAVEYIRDPSISARYLQFRAGLGMFRDYPLTGVGIGNYKARFREYAPEISRQFEAHNTYIEVLAETGLFGFFFFALIVVMGYADLKRAQYRAREGDLVLLFNAVEVGFLSILVSSFFFSGEYAKYLWIFMGLTAASKRIVSEESGGRGK